MLNMELSRREIERRNFLRAEAHLPLINVEAELQRAIDAEKRKECEQEYWAFSSSPLRQRVEEKLLSRIRRRIGAPDWRPTGVLSGGGWIFHVQVERRMLRLWRLRRRRAA